MKSFWWFEKDKIAGMARPGFNSCRWFDLPFDEAILMGWLGQHSSGPIHLKSFWEHVHIYVPKAAPFYKITDEQREKIVEGFHQIDNLKSILDRLVERTRFLESATLTDHVLDFKIHKSQLESEIEHLKQVGIQRLVTLTESHHLKEELKQHFSVHHIGIVDMGAPTLDQAQELSKILDLAEKNQEKTAVHCLAGIGRTSTMIMAAEILRGKKLPQLLETVTRQNPSYVFTGAQANFLRGIAESQE